MTESYSLMVNGERRVVRGGQPDESLLYVLRERLGLLGSKSGCEQGECGSCSVLVDGVVVCSCMVLAATVGQSAITTVEALSGSGDQLTRVQRAFVSEGAVQCGFCTPGLVLTVHALLQHNPSPTELEIREAVSGNLCRCTGYGRILQAILSASEPE